VLVVRSALLLPAPAGARILRVMAPVRSNLFLGRSRNIERRKRRSCCLCHFNWVLPGVPGASAFAATYTPAIQSTSNHVGGTHAIFRARTRTHRAASLGTLIGHRVARPSSHCDLLSFGSEARFLNRVSVSEHKPAFRKQHAYQTLFLICNGRLRRCSTSS
jgi:hypothetical protein